MYVGGYCQLDDKAAMCLLTPLGMVAMGLCVLHGHWGLSDDVGQQTVAGDNGKRTKITKIFYLH